MDVCHLVNSLERGGAETLLLEMARENATSDTDLSLSVCSVERAAPMAGELRDLGVEVRNLGAAFKFDPRAVVRMARYFRERSFDVLHTHLPLAQALGRTVGRLAGIDAIVATQHNVADNYHPATGALERLTRPLDDATVAVSAGVRRSFSSTEAWRTIYNGIDVTGHRETVEAADPASVRERWDLPPGPVLLNVARYRPEKAQRDLIAAMERVVETHPDASLLIVGGGPLEADLRRRIRSAGLGSNVVLAGHVPSVAAYYAAADVFVSSSLREGLPITLLEAMASDLPVVATAIPGVDELVVDGETGRLAPPGAPAALADRIREVLDPGIRRAFGRAGFDRVESSFDVSNTHRTYADLYRELVDSSRVVRP
jgi:glycosyltransferase involved in cell wall biosynthesis